ncbi:MAG TPA: hypothetical protein PKA50_12165 [Gemmatimonadales bacterium]|nr:hypothetical protein [Gemmatimonadales bacterium]
MRRMMVRAVLGLALAGGALPAAGQAVPGSDLPPAGFGVLNQDQLSVRFAASDLEVRFLPLDERILRLIANDGYDALKGLIASRQAAIDSAVQLAGSGEPGLALVSFFALRSDARFDPENLNLVYHNQLYRPVGMVPVTGNFTGRQLAVRTQASAIYVFDRPIPVLEPFDLSYAGTQSSVWNEALRRIDRARSQVLARWQAVQRDSTAPRP